MFNNVRIIINTRGRIDRQITLEHLRDNIRRHITLVCYPGERVTLSRQWRNKVQKIIEHPVNLTHLGAIRHWCIDAFKENIIIFMDDNMGFHAREKVDYGPGTIFPLVPVISKHYTDASIERIHSDVFQWMINKLSNGQYGIAGTSSRTGNHNHPGEEEENTRFFAMWGVNKIIYNRVGPYLYASYPIKQDFCLGLEMATAGVKNIVSYKYAHDKSASNSAGGVSVYRTVNMFNEYAQRLKRQFPQFVTLRHKPTKSWGGNFELYAWDVTIQWKRAYAYGVAKQKYRGIF